MRYRCDMSASDRAYGFAKQRILDGRFVGGQLITESDVALGAGVSRTPVREAFLRLEGEGFLRLYPKRGALVVPVSVAEVHSVLETRVVVERFAAEKVIGGGVELGRPLRAAIDRQRALSGPEYSRDFVDADREFHRILVAAAGNEILLQLHDSLRDRQTRMGLVALARDSDRTRQILHEHEAIANGIATRDRDLTLSIIERHIQRTGALLGGGFGGF
jgi:DNA-binding GntR family transcriptional regulator